MIQPLNENTRSAMVHLLLPDLRAVLSRNPDQAGEIFEELHPADGADLLATLEDNEVPVLLHHLSVAQAGELLSWAEPRAAARYLSGLPGELVADIFEEMDPDDRAEILSHFEEEEKDLVLSRMERPEREDAVELLSHADDTAGRLMNPQYLTVPVSGTAREALEQARAGARREWNVHALYVVDADGRLRGRIRLIDVLAAEPATPVQEFMDEDPPVVRVDTDQERVAAIMSKYDLLAVPVVSDGGVLEGIVTVDDVVDVLIEEGTEDVQRLGAVQPLETSYFETGFWTMLRKRGLWLVLLFFVCMFTGSVLQKSQAILAHTVSLVLFIPLIIASGGNSGAQSATLVIRALAVGELSLRHVLRVAYRELGMGLVLGTGLAIGGYGRALLWSTGHRVATTVAITMVGVVVAGTVMGSMLPLLLKRVRIDPAMASSPFVASVVDVTGILLYMTVVRLVLIR